MSGFGFDKDSVPRMPWRDIHVRLEGDIIKDMSRSFIQYWSFMHSDFASQKTAQVIVVSKLKQTEKEIQRKVTQDAQTVLKKNDGKFSSDFLAGKRTKKNNSSFGPDQDDSTPIMDRKTLAPSPSPLTTSQEPKDDSFKKRKRMFQSVQCSAKAEMQDLIKNLKSFHGEEEEFDPNAIIAESSEKPGKPKSFAAPKQSESQVQEKVSMMDRLRRLKNFGEQAEFEFKNSVMPRISSSFFSHNVQLLRSAGNWSLGLHKNKVEKSIQIAYLELIDKANHFIYIENQFFISGLAGEPIQNKIAEALVLRIRRAIEKGEKFLVVVVIPLQPGFEGTIEEGVIKRLTFAYQQKTITKSEMSIYSQLQDHVEHPEEYIRFYGLRNHGILPNGHPACEQVYIHSKMMIVDDQIALIGSANINDRSLLGSRDSEMAVVIEDETKVRSFMNGNNYMASEFAHNLRVQCFQRIFGLDRQEALDPIGEHSWTQIISNVKVSSDLTKLNTEFYRKVFGALPDNIVTDSSEQELFTKGADIRNYELMKQTVKGLAVEYPLRYLEKKDLMTKGLTHFGYYFVPDTLFT